MGSLRALTWLVVLLVLVPACVLAWMGFRGAAATDRAEDARIRADLERGAARLREEGARIARALEEEVRAALGEAARDVRTRLPLGAPGTVLVPIAARLGARHGVLDLKLVDGDGDALWPRAFDADGRAPAAPAARLLFDLRREADRLRFGAGDVDGALRVWSDAAGRVATGALRANALAELALLQARAGRGDPTRLLAGLRAALGPAEQAAAARPLTLLRIRAASMKDRAEAAALAQDWDAGILGEVPLTDAERVACRRAMAHARLPGNAPRAPRAGLRGPPDPEQEAGPSPQVAAEVAGGARLVARLDPQALRERVARHVDALDLRPLRARALTVPLDAWQPEAGAPRLTMRLPGAFGASLLVAAWHGEARAVEAARATRRTLTVLGVLSLLALMATGLVLVRRALRRERDARRLRDDFVANVSHELRTPLTSVTLHAEMLAEEDPPPERRRALARVVRAEGARLAALVDDLLDFAARERGGRALECEPVDVLRAAEDALAPYRTLAARDGVRVELEAPQGGDAVALADGGALARILANLLSNAWRHGRPARDGGAGRLRVVLRALPLEVAVEVRDDGPGIEADEREAIFDRFRRGHGAEGREGAGIGLALSRELARGMDGDLRVVEDAQETVLRLTLPAAPEVEA